MRNIVIIGGVAGGATAAARLRRLDEHARIVLFERGEFISFANCGLPYHIGGVIEDRGDLLLQTPERFHRRYNIDVRILCEVIRIDRDAKRVTVQSVHTGETYVEHYDQLILAPGGAPIVPPIPGVDAPGVFTLRNMADTDRIMAFLRDARPRRAVVVGGGYIGVEMAENLTHAGLAVSLVERLDQVIAPLDPEMAADAQHHLRENGVTLYMEHDVKAIAPGAGALTVALDDRDIAADLVILAVGVRPDSRLAVDAGLRVSERGAIFVDRAMRTSDESIYAVGDATQVTDFVTGQPAVIPLAGPANKQARIAADNLMGIPREYGGTQGSAILKVFDLAVATTGINEKTAQRLGLDFDKVYAWLPGHAGYYPGTKPMAIKAIFERGSGKILGAQIVGRDGVDKRADLLALAVRLRLTGRDLAELELCYAPPFGSAKDPVNMVGTMIENLLDGRVKQFHWHDVDALPRDGSVTLLDVRTPGEFRAGSISGFTNIPLDELRARVSEIPQGKPVYVCCHSGMRSYIACRILTQHGYRALNLAGGYRLYQSVAMERSWREQK